MYVEMEEGNTSQIKFGSYDDVALTSDLGLLKTYNEYTWSVRAKNFKIGDKDITTTTDRFVSLEPQLPYLYIPSDDFDTFTSQVHKIYDKWYNIRKKKQKCGDTYCKFE